MSETQLQEELAEYLITKYPDVMFHSDYGSGAKLNPKQSAVQMRQNGGRKGWPDMFIAEPRHYFYTRAVNMGVVEAEGWYRGLFLELKKDGTKLIRDKDARKILKGEAKLRKKGDWWDSHIEEQATVLEGLRERGYCAEFAVGRREAIRIIDEYLGGESGKERVSAIS